MAITLNGTTGISSPGGDTSVSLSTGTLSVSGTSTLSGNISFPNSTTLTAAATKTLTLNGGGGSNGLVLDASNNVGIGTSSPGTYGKFAVIGSVASSGLVLAVANTTDTGGDNTRYAGINFEVGSDRGTSAIRSFRTNSANNYETALAFFTNPSGATTTPVERMRLDSSGNLGLGVTPSAWSTNVRAFDINVTGGIGSFQNGTGSQQTFITNNAYLNTSNSWTYKFSGTAAMRYNQDAGQHQFFTAPSGTAGNAISFTQAMTLDASGNLLVGTTSALGKITVTQTTAGVTCAVLNGVSGAKLNLDYQGNGNIYYDAAYHLFRNIAGTVFAQIGTALTGTGNRAVYSDANGIFTNSSSDLTLKTNFVPVTDALDKTLALKPFFFNWIDTERFGAQRELGFGAQDVREIVPEVIGENSDGTLSLDYPKLTALLAAAIQELTTRLEALEAK